MKATDLTPGTVYLVSHRGDWLDYLGPRSFGYDRYAVRITDHTRYTRRSSWSSEYHESPTGQYLKGEHVDYDGKPTGDTQYFLPRFVRGTLDECKATVAKLQAAKDAAETARREKEAAAVEAADKLRARLEAAGVEGFDVGHYDGRPRHGVWTRDPHVTVDFSNDHRSRVKTIEALLDRLEAAEADAKAYRDETEDSVRSSWTS